MLRIYTEQHNLEMTFAPKIEVEHVHVPKISV